MLVFVCDDMMSYNHPLYFALKDMGHEVYSAKNGQEIMDVIEAPPDILFLDITMPVMGGIETLKQFREVHDEPVIIMLASIGQEQVAKQCLALGADEYIMKSPDKAQVSKLLAERFPAWEKLAKERIPELDLADTEDNDRQPWEFKFEKTVFDIDVKFPLSDTEYIYADGMEAKLERGYMLLEDRDWERADEMFSQVLDIDPRCSLAHLGLALAEKQCQTLRYLVYSSIDGNLIMQYDYNWNAMIKPDDERVEMIIKEVSIPNFLPAETIRELYEYKDVKYPSAVDQYTLRYGIEDQYWSENSLDTNMARAFKYAQGRAKQLLDNARWLIMDLMALRVEYAKSDEAEARQRAEAKYIKFLEEKDQELYALHKKALNDREQMYEEVKLFYPHSRDENMLHSDSILYFELEQLGDYKDAPQMLQEYNSLLPEIKKREAEQERVEKRIAAEKKRRLEKKEAAKRRRKRFVKTMIALVIIGVIGLAAAKHFILDPMNASNQAQEMINSGDIEGAVDQVGDLRKLSKEAKYDMAEALLEDDNIRGAAVMFKQAGNYLDAQERSKQLWDKVIDGYDSISLYGAVAFGIRDDGTVICTTSRDDVYHSENIAGWTDIVKVIYEGDESQRYTHAAGLRSDGTVVMSCLGRYCDDEDCDTSDWTDIVDIAFSSGGTLYGLKSDGTIVGNDLPDYLLEAIDKMEPICAIAMDGTNIAGLKPDGTITFSIDDRYEELRALTDVKQIGWGLMAVDGSGDIHTDFTAYERFSGFETEKYIFSYINGRVVIGLSDDGKVVWGKETEERSEWFLRDELSSWEGLADLYAGRNAVVLGLKPDGSVVITSNHWNYSEEISQWTNIRIPKR
ncbi:MAG: response regulator [Clostridia bacterium]|nr:response regulator [Clostridia bacterium]